MFKFGVLGSTASTTIVLDALISCGFEVSYVFCVAGKHSASDDTQSLIEISRAHNIPSAILSNVNDLSVLNTIKSAGITHLFAVGFSKLLASRYFQLGIVIIGFHPTVLPQGRGRCPVAWMIRDENMTPGWTFFLMDEGCDTGDILFQHILDRNDFADAEEYSNLVLKTVSEQLPIWFNRGITDLLSNRRRQTEIGSSVLPLINVKDGYLDLNVYTSNEIITIIRATTTPNPGAYFEYKGLKIKILKAELPYNTPKIDCDKLSPGLVLDASDSSFMCQLKDGVLKVTKWESEIPIKVGLNLNI